MFLFAETQTDPRSKCGSSHFTAYKTFSFKRWLGAHITHFRQAQTDRGCSCILQLGNGNGEKNNLDPNFKLVHTQLSDVYT